MSRSRDMLPVFASAYQRDCRSADTKNSTKQRLRQPTGIQSANQPHRKLVKFCHTVLRSAGMRRPTGPTLGVHVGHVGRLRAQKKMIGVDASPVVAAVQNAGAMVAAALGNWAATNLPRDAMGSLRSTVYAKLTVAFAGSTLPLPALVRLTAVDFAPEALYNLTVHSGYLSLWTTPLGVDASQRHLYYNTGQVAAQ